MEVKASDYNGEVELQKEGDVTVLNTGPDAPRFAVFCETKGIYIENDVWSYESGHEEHDRIITYVKYQVDFLVEYFKKKGIEVVVVLITPDRKFGNASIAACVAAGLPAWEYDEDKYGKDPKKYDGEEDVEQSDDQELPEAQTFGGES